ncbi:MAG: RNA-directed DNA polymerase, partial [Muribaculaceae bacterium]|nr:RNA-directed DNA polymerase [Muribaculaceae bacterium]
NQHWPDEDYERMEAEIENAANQHWPDEDEQLEAALVKMGSKGNDKKNIFSTAKEHGGKRKQPKPIVELEAGEALDFLMESEQYCRTELPRYFDFSGVLEYAKERVGDLSLRECTVKGMSPAELDGVNLEMMTNKDGRYGVRPLTLANPFLYYILARDMCREEAWKGIQQCFALYKDEHISACAIPMVKQDDRPEAFRGSTAVLNWWNSMEQTSIELSLRYRFMFVTDITNCFGQINPESIGWALSLKDTEHETDRNDCLAKDIMEYLRAMQHGRNMGIPQGSTLFGFIAEIILGYSDMLFTKAVREAQARKELPTNLDYHVLRYVDDFRIFCSDREALDKLSYILQEVLEKFNFRMNSSKTKISSNIISDTIKPDKMFYIFNTPIESKQTYRGEDDELVRRHAYDFDGFQKHLLYIYEFSRKFPNAGQLKNQLSAFSRRLDDFLNGETSTVRSFSLDEDGEKSKNSTKKNHLWENRPVMVAIAVQIAEDNVAAAHYALKVASQILADMPEGESEKKLEIIRLI